MPIKKSIKIDFSVIIALSLPYTYLCIYLMEFGYFTEYNIPLEFLEVNFKNLFGVGAPIVVIVFMGVLLGFVTYTLLKHFTPKNAHLIALWLGVQIIATMLLIMFEIAIFSKINLLVICIDFTIVACVILGTNLHYNFYLKRQVRNKTWPQKKAFIIKQLNNQFVTFSQIGRRNILIALALVMLPVGFQLLGGYQAINDTKFLILDGKEDFIILRKYDDQLICRKLDSNFSFRDGRTFLIKMKNDTSYRFLILDMHKK
jgi:hypothetical protein